MVFDLFEESIILLAGFRIEHGGLDGAVGKLGGFDGVAFRFENIFYCLQVFERDVDGEDVFFDGFRIFRSGIDGIQLRSIAVFPRVVDDNFSGLLEKKGD